MLEDEAELAPKPLPFLVGESEAREARDVIDVDLDRHGASVDGARRPSEAGDAPLLILRADHDHDVGPLHEVVVSRQDHVH